MPKYLSNGHLYSVTDLCTFKCLFFFFLLYFILKFTGLSKDVKYPRSKNTEILRFDETWNLHYIHYNKASWIFPKFLSVLFFNYSSENFPELTWVLMRAIFIDKKSRVEIFYFCKICTEPSKNIELMTTKMKTAIYRLFIKKINWENVEKCIACVKMYTECFRADAAVRTFAPS